MNSLNDVLCLNWLQKFSQKSALNIVFKTPRKSPAERKVRFPESKTNEEDEAKRLTAEIVTKSYLLTELAANQDPNIAKQNQEIAEQRKLWESAKAPKNTKSADPNILEANRRAEALVNLSFQTTLDKALQDPRVAEANRQIAEQKQQLQELTTVVEGKPE
jgi:hypothetical protein